MRADVSVMTLVEVFTADMVYCTELIVIFPPASMLLVEATVTVVAPVVAAAASVVLAKTEESLIPQA